MGRSNLPQGFFLTWERGGAGEGGWNAAMGVFGVFFFMIVSTVDIRYTEIQI